MITENREDYINYRLQRAEESYEDAKLLAKNERWNTVANRLYYCCFYAVIALLLKNNIKTTTHEGSRRQFGLHFIKTGKLDKKFGRFYTKMSDFRQKGDYGDLFDFDKETIDPLFELVREFLEEIKKNI